MKKSNQEFINRCEKAWNESVQVIYQRFGLTSPGGIAGYRLSNEEDSFSQYMLGILNDTEVVINSQLYADGLLGPILAKLCFERCLPREILCDECIDDLSFEFARSQLTDGSLRQKWEELWENHRPPEKISTVVTYEPRSAYRWLYSLAGDKGLEAIVREIAQRAKNQMPLSFEDYLLYFTSRVNRIVNTLDTTELKIVSNLVGNSSDDISELAKRVELSSEWVSKKVSELQKRMILRKFNRVPFSRIEIQMFHVGFERMFGSDNAFDFMKDCPFLYSYRKVVSGDWEALATLCVPYNSSTVSYLNQGMEKISKKGFNIHIHQIHSSGVSHCFDYYRTDEGIWDIPWELLTVQLGRIKSDGLGATIPRVDTPQRKTSMNLQSLEMNVLDCFRRGIATVSEIRSELRVGQQRVADTIRELRNAELIQTVWEAHNIGLNEHVFLYEQTPSDSLAIAGWSRRLPRCIVSFSAKEELMLLAALPRGGSYGLAASIDEVSPSSRIGILSPKAYGSWGFPLHLWDSRYQKWKCPETEIQQWLSSLNSGSRPLQEE